VLGRRLENHVEVLGQADGELMCIRGSHRDITISTDCGDRCARLRFVAPESSRPRVPVPTVVTAWSQTL
jgi:hypothetical protein